MMKSQFPWIALTGALLALAGIAAQAQPMYRIVGPDGKVTFSDRPPPDAAAGTAKPARVTTSPAPDSNASLPFELRQVVNRYPVTIYSGANCSPCDSARNLLINRGVPFAERTVTTNEDVDALQRLSGGASLPFATIGGQQLKGYSDVTWTQYLDAAGYAKTSQLPSGYRQPPATPLVAAKVAGEVARPTNTATPAAAPAANSAPMAPPVQRTTENPAGIRF